MASSVRKAMTFFGLAAEAPSEEEGEMMYEEEIAEVTPFPSGTQTPTTVSRGVHEEVHRIVTVHPRTYNDARGIGEAYRDSIPVIMNLSDMSDSDAKRLVDFASGLVFALRGSLERVTPKVFLLSPEFVEVTTNRAAAKENSSLFNQS